MIADWAHVEAHANKLLDSARDARIPPELILEGMRALATPERAVLQMQMDEVLAEWFRALSEQAGIAGPGAVPMGRAKGKRQKTKRRR